MLVVELEQLITELRQRREVPRLAAAQRGRPVVGTAPASLLDLLLRLELLAALAVEALVLALVNVAVVEDLLDELAAALVMPRLAGLDEIVEGDFQRAPDLLELTGHVVAVFLRITAQLGGLLRHLDRVLGVAHQEEGVIT